MIIELFHLVAIFSDDFGVVRQPRASAFPLCTGRQNLSNRKYFDDQLSKAGFFLTKWYLITYEKWIFGKSKMVHEMDQILTDFDDFGVVEKLWISAVQRRQNHQNPWRIDRLHDAFLISSQMNFRS